MTTIIQEVTKMMLAYDSFPIKTTRVYEVLDITERIQGIIAEAGIKNGNAVVQMSNTTARIFINENESGLIDKDFFATLERIAPMAGSYQHDDFDIRTQNLTPVELIGKYVNGHSHCKALVLPFSVTIIIRDGKMRLGNWGRIMLVELDRARDDRMVEVSIIGSKE